jgi:hypothetical protein
MDVTLALSALPLVSCTFNIKPRVTSAVLCRTACGLVETIISRNVARLKRDDNVRTLASLAQMQPVSRTYLLAERDSSSLIHFRSRSLLNSRVQALFPRVIVALDSFDWRGMSLPRVRVRV